MGFLEAGKSYRKINILRSKKTDNRTIGNVWKKTKRPLAYEGQTERASKKRRKTPQLSILERLPVEILHEIFTYVGLEENNSILLTNSHLHSLVRVEKRRNSVAAQWTGINLILKLIRRKYYYNLNRDVNFFKIEKKMRYYSAKYPSLLEHATYKELREALETFKKHEDALDIRLFNYKFVDANLVRLLKSAGKYRPLPLTVIDSELKFRGLYLETKLKEISELKRQIARARDGEEDAAEEAEQDAQITSLKDSISDYDHDQVSKTITFPLYFYNGSISENKLQVMQAMSEHFRVKFDDNRLLFRKLFQDMSLLNYRKFILDATEADAKVHLETILDLFTIIGDLAGESGDISDQLVEIIRFFLEAFYSSHAPNDAAIWQLVSQLKIPLMMDLTVEYGGSPTMNLINL